jgi:hypothetical protein
LRSTIPFFAPPATTDSFAPLPHSVVQNAMPPSFDALTIVIPNVSWV